MSAAGPTERRSSPDWQKVCRRVRRDLVEDGWPVAASLELEEAVDTGDESYAVPQAARLLPARYRRHHRAEERDSLDMDHRRPDVHADGVHPGVVRLAQCDVVVRRVH